jgi:PhnB protein
MPLLPSGPDGVNGLSSRGSPAVNASHTVDYMFDRAAIFKSGHACNLQVLESDCDLWRRRTSGKRLFGIGRHAQCTACSLCQRTRSARVAFLCNWCLRCQNSFIIWRRGRDSNPRGGLSAYTLSRRACSATPAPLQVAKRFAAVFGKSGRVMQLEPYLFFYGRCEEALNFYKRIFGGEITRLDRFEGSFMESQVPPEQKKKIIHSTFKADSFSFMASDGRSSGPAGEGNVSLSLAAKSEAEGKAIFDNLSEGGSVSMPFDNVPWGGKFGSLTDKFGIEWMVSTF